MTIPIFPAARRAVIAALLLGAACICTASGVTGRHYTNFGKDLRVPIFPGKNWLHLYTNKDDAKPVRELGDARVIDTGAGDWEACIGKAGTVARVRCHVRGADTWVNRWSFIGPREIVPVEPWPFRYWLHLASDGADSEETAGLYKAVPRSIPDPAPQ